MVHGRACALSKLEFWEVHARVSIGRHGFDAPLAPVAARCALSCSILMFASKMSIRHWHRYGASVTLWPWIPRKMVVLITEGWKLALEFWPQVVVTATAFLLGHCAERLSSVSRQWNHVL